VVPVHEVKAYRGSRHTAPLLLNLGSICRWVVNFTSWLLYLWERTPVPIESEAGWAPELVWTFWRRKKSFACTVIQTPGHPAHRVVTILPWHPQSSNATRNSEFTPLNYGVACFNYNLLKLWFTSWEIKFSRWCLHRSLWSCIVLSVSTDISENLLLPSSGCLMIEAKVFSAIWVMIGTHSEERGQER
jgi:hypothetical protein